MEKTFLLASALLLLSIQNPKQAYSEPAGPLPGVFHSVHRKDDGVDGYVLRLPDGYDPSRRYPLLLSLHSSGQTGGPVEEGLFHGPAGALRRNPGAEFDTLRREFILLCPHLSEGPYEERQWFDRPDTLDALLVETARAFRIDLSRIYVVGYSTGGTGTWGYASRRPGQFAAVIAAAGFTRPDFGIKKQIVESWEEFRRLPVWAFYNASDRSVGFSHGRNAVAAIEALDGSGFLVLNHTTLGPDPYRGSVVIDTPPGDLLGRKRILSIYRIGIHSEGRIWDNPVLYDWLLGHSNPEYSAGALYRALGEGY